MKSMRNWPNQKPLKIKEKPVGIPYGDYRYIDVRKTSYEQSRELIPKENIPSKLYSQDVTICAKRIFFNLIYKEPKKKVSNFCVNNTCDVHTLIQVNK